MRIRPLLFFFIIGLITSLLWSVFAPADIGSDKEILFVVEKGQGSREIAYNLEQENLIRLSGFFRIYTLTIGISKELQAGTYTLSPSMGLSTIASKMAKGETATNKVTVIEGWNIRDIAQHLEGKGIVQAEEFMEIAGFPGIDYRVTRDLPEPTDFSQDYIFLKDKPKYVGLEGYLFPETYFIPIEASAIDISEMMLNMFDTKVTTEVRAEAARQGKSLFEVITIASLLEKEVRTMEDKRLVAGILERRLRIGMALQVDATVSYLTNGNTTKVTAKDLAINSLYNTYEYPGVPLGPIANPGMESIQAALTPQESNYLYYLSTPDGETIFSETLEQHNEAKVTYLR